MAEITYGVIVNAMDALKKIGESELSMPILYKANKLLKKIDGELEFFNKKRQKIISKYGVKIEEDKYKIEDQESFNKEMAELLAVKIDGIAPVEIPTSERISLSYNDLCSLNGLVTITEEVKS